MDEREYGDSVLYTKDVDYEVLKSLREITRLGPIAEFKILRARKSAEKYRELYMKDNPSDEISVDYSTVNDLEYQLRIDSLKRKLEKTWLSYLSYENDGIGLDEFVSDYLVQYLNDKSKGRKM